MSSLLPSDSPLPVLDQSRLLEEFGDCPEILGELRDLFLGHAPPLLRQMREAWERRDCEALARAAHSLKGASSTYGALRMSEVCRALEAEAREGRLEIMAEGLQLLDAELEQVTATFGNLAQA